MVSQEIQEILKRAGTWDSYQKRHRLDEALNIDLSSYYTPAVKVLDDSIDWSGGGGEMVYHAYAQQYGFDIEEEDPTESEQFKKWLPLYLKSLIELAEDRISRKIMVQKGKILVWRVLAAPEDWLQKGIHERGLGVFWSWSEGSAEAHWAGSGVEYLIASAVFPKEVDWIDTLAVNANPTQEEEREIRIHEGTPMPILGVAVTGRGVKTQRLDVSHLANQYFPA